MIEQGVELIDERGNLSMNKKILGILLLVVCIGVALMATIIMPRISNPDSLTGLALPPNNETPSKGVICYGDMISLRSSQNTNYYLNTSTSMFPSPINTKKQYDAEFWVILDEADLNSRRPVKYNDKLILKKEINGDKYITIIQFDQAVMFFPRMSNEGKWTISGPNNKSGDFVKANDIVNLQNPDDKITAPNNWYIGRKDYYQNWMAYTTEIHSKLLREITFPASHDSGAREFSNEIAPESEDSAVLTKTLEDVNKLVDSMHSIKVFGKEITLPSKSIISIKQKLTTKIYDSIKRLSKCTDLTIAEQLDQGIRWLDLRIYRKAGGAQLHHFLTAGQLDKEVASIQSFLSSTEGEILFVEMSHMIGDNKNNTALMDLVKNKLGDYAYIKELGPDGKVTNNPFDKRYTDVVGSPQKSKVILIVSEFSDDKMFWDLAQLGLAEDPKSETYRYAYANTSNPQKMFQVQLEHLNQAKKNNQLFTLWYTLTTNEAESVSIIKSEIKDQLPSLLADEFVKMMPAQDEISKIVGTIGSYVDFITGKKITDPKEIFESEIKSIINAGVAPYLKEKSPGYSSTHELSIFVNPAMDYQLSKFQSKKSNQNNISVIFADFTNESLLVETAIEYSRMKLLNK